MTTPLTSKTRRTLTILFALVLCLLLVPFALGDSSARDTPPATTDDAVQVNPTPATTGDAAQTNPAPATTGGAAQAMPPANLATLGESRADEPWPVLTIEFNQEDDNDPDANTPMQSKMKQKFDTALNGRSWDDVTKLVLKGDATTITQNNWDYLRNMCFFKKVGGVSYAGENNKLRALDLTGMTNLTEIFGTAAGPSPDYDKPFIPGPSLTNPSGYDPTKYRHVYLPDSLTTIGDHAFEVCHTLSLDELPPKLAVIGANAFDFCVLLDFTALPSTVTEIGYAAFMNCAALKLTTLPASAVITGEAAFAGAGIKTMKLPADSVMTKLPATTFMQCQDLKAVDLSESNITTLDYGAFQDCTNLTTVSLPETLTNIGGAPSPYGGNTFQRCRKLSSINIPASVNQIRTLSFDGCWALPAVDLSQNPADLSIESDAFQGCRGLTTIDLSGKTKLTNFASAFPGSHPKLETVNLSGTGITAIKDNTFKGCKKLTTATLPDAVTSIGNSAFNGCAALTTVNLPAAVTSIGNSAFNGCAALTTVNLPAAVTSIGNSAFDGCAGLTDITVACNPANNATAITSFTALFGGPHENLQAVDLSGWNNLSNIEGAFQGCTKLTTATLPDDPDSSLTAIGNSAFDGCAALTTVNLPAKVTSIGNSAFDGCKLLNTTIPTSVTSIGASAFNGCAALTTVTLPAAVTSIGSSAFDGCTGLTDITVACNPSTTSFTGLFGDTHANLQTVDLNGWTSLSNIDNAFKDCKNLETVDLSHAALTAIGASAFQNCAALTTVSLPNAVTSIGDSAFDGCKLLNTTIPTSVTSIGSSAFQNCTALNTTIPTSVTSIGNSAFNGCAALTTVTLPTTVTSIGASAFNDCTGLTAITVLCNPDNTPTPTITSFTDLFGGPHASLQTVDLSGWTSLSNIEGAFKDCTALTTANLSETAIEKIPQETFKNCGKLDNLMLTGCTALSEADLSDTGLTTVQNSMFKDCAALTTVNLPNAVASIGNSAFQDCTSLSCNVNAPGDPAGYGIQSLLDHVTTIGESAFKGCENLTDLLIPTATTALGENAFQGCTGLHNVYFQGSAPPTMPNNSPGSVFPTPSFSANETMVLFVPEDTPAYQTDNWTGLDKNRVEYHLTSNGKGNMVGLKPSQDGNPPAYEVWETVEFRPIAQLQPANMALGDSWVDGFNSWELLPPAARTRDSRLPIASGTLGTPPIGHIYPSARPAGIYTIHINGTQKIFVGDQWNGLGPHESLRPLPFGNSAYDTLIEFLPPPVPAEASYLLTVKNGTGGGYYQAEDSAPVAATLKAVAPQSGAKFLRWELKSGTGTFADANAPETRFTMAVGDSTVEAVFDTSAAPQPSVKPGATTNPPTGDSGVWPALAGLLLAGIGTIIVRKRVKQ